MVELPHVIEHTCARQPRVDLAIALLRRVQSDDRLRLALAVCEARHPGYVGALIGHAHTICGSLSSSSMVVPSEAVEEAIASALDWASPKRILVTPSTDPDDASERALVRLIEANVEFHSTAGGFDRRLFPRTADEWVEHLSIDREISPADWLR
jgi:hypothetical protein